MELRRVVRRELECVNMLMFEHEGRGGSEELNE